MTLTPISNTVEFVQDTVPTTAADGDSWLDTSLTPPRLKIFDADVGGFIEPRSIQNLDAPVSGAGATQTDIETAVDNSNTGETVSSNLDAPVSASGADLRFIGEFQLSVASFLQSFAPGQTTDLIGISFNPNGTAMFIIGRSSDSVFQYSLGSAFDLSSASFTGNSFNVSAETNDPQGVTFNPDGTSMFTIGRISESVFQYSLGSAFDLSSASFTGNSFNVSGQDSNPQGVTFNPDGTSMFIIGDSSDSVFQYSLNSGFDIGTASFSGTSFDVSGQDGFPAGVTFNPDGTLMFIVGRNFDSVFQYLVGEVGPK